MPSCFAQNAFGLIYSPPSKGGVVRRCFAQAASPPIPPLRLRSGGAATLKAFGWRTVMLARHPNLKSPPTDCTSVVTTSEQHLDRKLKLALALIRFINAKIPSFVQVAGRSEVVDVVQEVVRLNPKLDIEGFADEAGRDVLKE
jgi:hypothetical protein